MENEHTPGQGHVPLVRSDAVGVQIWSLLLFSLHAVTSLVLVSQTFLVYGTRAVFVQRSNLGPSILLQIPLDTTSKFV